MLPRSHRAPLLDESASPTLKKYRLLGLLAKGGMAEVFLARADGLAGFERLLVIKRILPELASDTEFVRMFLDEARIAATLHHTNIVQVHEVDVADGQVFYAMEHLHGQDVATTLQRLTERGMRIPLGNAIAISAAVAAGLHYAHDRRGSDGQPLDIVHRDVAPSNVIVTYDGNVKLIDFGIAKAANNLSRTRFGLFKGRLPYASPEQCRCEQVDRRTDVFSLGVLLYELTTGQRLFTADNEYELIRVVSEAVVPRPRLRDKAYPRDLEAIVLKALAQNRDDRYPSAYALQCDLEAFSNRMQLDLSAMSLSRLMERLFANELTRWRSAERAGVTLEQHIITTTTNQLALDDQADDTDVIDPSDGSAGATAPPPGPSGVGPVTVQLPQPPARPRSRATRYAVLAGAAIALIGAGAMAALWWSARPSAGSAAVPAVQRAAPIVAPSVPEPEQTPAQAPAQTPEQAPAQAIETPAAPEPVQPPEAEQIELETEHAAPPPRRTKRTHPRPASPLHPAPSEEAPATAAPAVRSRPVLDDATLDKVSPRSTGSR